MVKRGIKMNLPELTQLKEFEEKFGFKAYDELKVIISRLIQRISDLEHSRDNWRDKFYGRDK